MKISDDTTTVIEFLDNLSQEGLRKKNDLSAILEISATSGNYQIVNQIVFTGKSVFNLYSKLKKTTSQNVEILQKELARSADELKKMLAELIPIEIGDIRKRFEVTYFADNSGCLANLIDLSFDLSVLKEAQMRREEFSEQK